MATEKETICSVRSMRKILWMILLFSAYVWVITSGHEGVFLEKGKAIYQAFLGWFDDAELNFHLKPDKKSKKHSRRWN